MGCELGQAFARLGTKVTMFVRSSRILSKDDPDASEYLSNSMKDDGVNFFYNSEPELFIQEDE
jgi:pyruvate/2-oxoglutarate dehydrogenase complex dihydrolipoamide dehydrogenase (E3) component